MSDESNIRVVFTGDLSEATNLMMNMLLVMDSSIKNLENLALNIHSHQTGEDLEALAKKYNEARMASLEDAMRQYQGLAKIISER